MSSLRCRHGPAGPPGVALGMAMSDVRVREAVSVRVVDEGLVLTAREKLQLRRAQALLDQARERLNAAGIGDEQDGVNAGACAAFLDELLASVETHAPEGAVPL